MDINFDPNLAHAQVATHTQAEEIALTQTVDAKVQKLQNLWKTYEGKPSPKLQGAISKGVKELESLVSHWPYGKAPTDKRWQEAQDYVLACNLYLAELPTLKAKVSPREEALQAIHQDFTVVEAGGEGNCCLHAALFATNPNWNTPEMIELVRGDVVTKMRTTLLDEVDNHWQDAKNYATRYLVYLGEHHGSQAQARKLVNDYCNQMAAPGTWFGEFELPFLSDYLQRTLIVYDPDKMALNEGGEAELNRDLLEHGHFQEKAYILHNGCHYQALIPKNKNGNIPSLGQSF